MRIRFICFTFHIMPNIHFIFEINALSTFTLKCLVCGRVSYRYNIINIYVFDGIFEIMRNVCNFPIFGYIGYMFELTFSIVSDDEQTIITCSNAFEMHLFVLYLHFMLNNYYRNGMFMKAIKI